MPVDLDQLAFRYAHYPDVVALIEEARRLREDAARLDWLEGPAEDDGLERVEWWYGGGAQRYCYFYRAGYSTPLKRRTLRECIDAARKGE